MQARTSAPLATPYRAGQFRGDIQGSGDYFRDPERAERGLQGHGRTADTFAEFLQFIGYEPLAPSSIDCRFDLAYVDTNGVLCVCEVKSLTVANETWQIRHGLGQVLDYAHWLELDGRYGRRVRPLLILETEPARRDYWRSLCSRNGVGLT